MVFSIRSDQQQGPPARRLPWRARRVAVGLAGLLFLAPCLGLDQARLQEAAGRLSPRAVAEVAPLLQLIERAAGQDELRRLALVNDFFNRRIAFTDDIDTWGQVEYWASPMEALSKGRGDCEDYAIAKYFSLVSAGMPVSKLRMVYVRAMLNGRSLAHMVLAYYAQPGAEPLILDNLVPELRPASARSDLQPVFSFNSEGLWDGVGASSKGDPMQRLSLWRELLAKVRAEGF
jgi:predicted transglutaminase-like cysteine proteinase